MPDENQQSTSRPASTNTTVIVGAQPYVTMTPLADQRPSKWRYLFIILGILQTIGVALFGGVLLFTSQLSKTGASGTEFIVLAASAVIVPFISAIALINIVGLPIYIVKRKLRGKAMAFAIVSLAFSLILALFGAYIIAQLYSVPKGVSEQSNKDYQQKRQQFASDNAKPEITKDEAIQLLQACKLKGFYYTDQADKSNPAGGGWGELSSTGVVLTKVDGQPYRISIADRLIAELVPIARQAQVTCVGGPQFWHDGSYEQYKDGRWYFNGQVVNTIQGGKTKEEAINLMQSCKVDYFIGYTSDMSLVKDDSSKSWLKKAEQSVNGVAILENSPKTYVFASKSMTAELQDSARRFRQACYDTKKLYIMIDDSVETEYPIGTWTKVKQ